MWSEKCQKGFRWLALACLALGAGGVFYEESCKDARARASGSPCLERQGLLVGSVLGLVVAVSHKNSLFQRSIGNVTGQPLGPFHRLFTCCPLGRRSMYHTFNPECQTQLGGI